LFHKLALIAVKPSQKSDEYSQYSDANHEITVVEASYTLLVVSIFHFGLSALNFEQTSALAHYLTYVIKTFLI
jgi:hypothetical protein